MADAIFVASVENAAAASIAMDMAAAMSTAMNNSRATTANYLVCGNLLQILLDGNCEGRC